MFAGCAAAYARWNRTPCPNTTNLSPQASTFADGKMQAANRHTASLRMLVLRVSPMDRVFGAACQQERSRKADATQKILESRVRVQRIEHGIHTKIDQPVAVFGICALEPGNRLISVMQPRMDRGRAIRKHVPGFLLFDLFHLQPFSPIRGHAAAAIRASEIVDHRLRITSHTCPLLVRRKSLRITTSS